MHRKMHIITNEYRILVAINLQVLQAHNYGNISDCTPTVTL